MFLSTGAKDKSHEQLSEALHFAFKLFYVQKLASIPSHLHVAIMTVFFFLFLTITNRNFRPKDKIKRLLYLTFIW